MLVGEKWAVISLGVGCQTEHQIIEHTELLKQLLKDPSLKKSSGVFDWQITPIDSVTKAIQTHSFHPQKVEELSLARKTARWREGNLFYIHDFGSSPFPPEAITQYFPQAHSKWQHKAENLLSTIHIPNIIFIISNIQDSLFALARNTGFYQVAITASSLLQLQSSLQQLFTGRLHFAFFTHPHLYIPDTPLNNFLIRYLAPDPTPWEGDTQEWEKHLRTIPSFLRQRFAKQLTHIYHSQTP